MINIKEFRDDLKEGKIRIKTAAIGVGIIAGVGILIAVTRVKNVIIHL